MAPPHALRGVHQAALASLFPMISLAVSGVITSDLLTPISRQPFGPQTWANVPVGAVAHPLLAIPTKAQKICLQLVRLLGLDFLPGNLSPRIDLFSYRLDAHLLLTNSNALHPRRPSRHSGKGCGTGQEVDSHRRTCCTT